MSTVFEGNLTGAGIRAGIVVGRFNDFITSHLLDGAKDALVRHGASADDIDVAYVPGCFEIPIVAKRMAISGRYDVVICLGTVIRGSTPHFDYVAGQVANGVGHVNWETGIPCIFGVLTTDDIQQAIERAGTKAGNKGWDAGITAIEMVNLLRLIDKR